VPIEERLGHKTDIPFSLWTRGYDKVVVPSAKELLWIEGGFQKNCTDVSDYTPFIFCFKYYIEHSLFQNIIQ
jgi:hypothetical protein